jgi:hypothetical protein
LAAGGDGVKELKLVFTNAKQCHGYLKDIWAMVKGAEWAGGWEIIVRPFKVKRSNAANARLWVIHTKAAMAINLLTLKSGQNKGHKWTRDDMHEHFKEQYCGTDYSEVNGRKIFRMKSSTELSREEMALAQEKYMAYLVSDLGLELDFEDGKEIEHS